LLQKSFTSEKYIAYKVFGKCDPVLLISGASIDMNAWEPHTVLPKYRNRMLGSDFALFFSHLVSICLAGDRVYFLNDKE